MAKLSDMVAPFDQINAQYNAPFAGLAASTLRQAQPFEGLGDYVNGIYENKRKREQENNLLAKQMAHNKEMVKMQHDLGKEATSNQLKIQYALLGGTKDPTNLSDYDIASYIHTLQNPKQPSTTSPSLQGLNTIEGNYDVPTIIEKDDSRISQLDLPTYNAKGRLTLDDLQYLGQRYPYMSRTPEGRNMLQRIETTINNDPENRKALLPLLHELNNGKIQLIPPLQEADRSPFKLPDTVEDSMYKDFSNMRRTNPNIPKWTDPTYQWESWIASHTDVAAEDAENYAKQFGYIPPIRQESSGLTGYVKDLWNNNTRFNDADDYMKKFKKTYASMKNLGIERFEPNRNDQVTNEYRARLAKELGLASAFDVIPLQDNYGRLYLLSDNVVYQVLGSHFVKIIDNSGK